MPEYCSPRPAGDGRENGAPPPKSNMMTQASGRGSKSGTRAFGMGSRSLSYSSRSNSSLASNNNSVDLDEVYEVKRYKFKAQLQDKARLLCRRVTASYGAGPCFEAILNRSILV